MTAALEPSLDLEPASPEVRRYARQKRVAGIASALLAFAFLATFALASGPDVGEWLRARVGDNRWLLLLAVAFVLGVGSELLTLPLDFYSGYVLEHRYDLSNQSLTAWAWRRVKGYLIGGPFAALMLVGLYAVMWYGGAWWWLWTAVAFLGVTLVLGQLVPVLILPLFYKVTRLDDAALLQRLRHLTDGTDLTLEGVYRLNLSADTKKANAALTGLGKSRRVLLGDTLLEQFTPEEIEVVFAHEVGHHVYRHLRWMVAATVVSTAAGLWLVDFLLRHGAPWLRYTSFDAPAALPLVMLVLSLFGLLLGPLHNAVSRLFERQCDAYALRRTRAPEAYRSAFAKLARVNKADPDPHWLTVWLWHDHPPIRERLAMAEGWMEASR